MAKVSRKLGFTFRVGALDLNQYARVDLSIDQIDTELPIKPQVEAALETDKIIAEIIQERVDATIEDILDEGK
tara:strand:+ start:194 stop:412 length:219 start_codon:yes stop_codon:yes gene_type:complete